MLFFFFIDSLLFRFKLFPHYFSEMIHIILQFFILFLRFLEFLRVFKRTTKLAKVYFTFMNNYIICNELLEISWKDFYSVVESCILIFQWFILISNTGGTFGCRWFLNASTFFLICRQYFIFKKIFLILCRLLILSFFLLKMRLSLRKVLPWQLSNRWGVVSVLPKAARWKLLELMSRIKKHSILKETIIQNASFFSFYHYPQVWLVSLLLPS